MTIRLREDQREAVDAVDGRVVRSRGYGNAIVPQLASQFILSFMEALTEL